MTKTPEQQIATRDDLVRAAIFAVDSFAIDNRRALAIVPSAVANRLIVHAAIGYLVGHNLIEATDWPEWLTTDLPAHLVPDVAGAAAGNRAVRDAIFPGGMPR